MTYKHGIFTSEQATGLIPMTETDAGLIVAFGTAPVHLASTGRRKIHRCSAIPTKMP